MTKRLIQKKICLLGDFAVGKTSLIRRYVEGKYDEKYLSTIGVNISRKSVELDNHILNMLIWDLAGGDDFSKLGRSYLSGAVAALVVCDLTREETITSYQFYTAQMRSINPQVKLLFIGNKSDLETDHCIDIKELTSISTTLGGRFLATSAKTGFQVEEAFRHLAEQIEI